MRKASRKAAIPTSTGARRCYSLAEAGRSLVLVKRIVGDIVADYSRLVDLQEAVEAAQAAGGARRLESARDEITQTVERLQRALEELEMLGVELKDWSLGVVDFPCLADGREIRLTWQFGQEAVCHWHELHNPSLLPIETLPGAQAVPVGG